MLRRRLLFCRGTLAVLPISDCRYHLVAQAVDWTTVGPSVATYVPTPRRYTTTTDQTKAAHSVPPQTRATLSQLQQFLCDQQDIDGTTPLCTQVYLFQIRARNYVVWPTVAPQQEIAFKEELVEYIAQGKMFKRSSAYQPMSEDALKAELTSRRCATAPVSKELVHLLLTHPALFNMYHREARLKRWSTPATFPHLTITTSSPDGTHVHLSYQGVPVLRLSRCCDETVVSVEPNSPLTAPFTPLIGAAKDDWSTIIQHVNGVVDQHASQTFVDHVECHYCLKPGPAQGFVGVHFDEMETAVRKTVYASRSATAAQLTSRAYMESLMHVISSRPVIDPESRVSMTAFEIIVINGESGCGKSYEAFYARQRFCRLLPAARHWGIYITAPQDSGEIVQWEAVATSATRNKDVVKLVVDLVVDKLNAMQKGYTGRPLTGTPYLADVRLVLTFDEMGRYPAFVRGLIASRKDIQHEISQRLGTPIADVFLAIAGTGVATTSKPEGSLPQQYGMIDATTPLQGLYQALLSHHFGGFPAAHLPTLSRCIADDATSVNLCTNARVAFHYIEALAAMYRDPTLDTSVCSSTANYMQHFFSRARDLACDRAVAEYRRRNVLGSKKPTDLLTLQRDAIGLLSLQDTGSMFVTEDRVVEMVRLGIVSELYAYTVLDTAAVATKVEGLGIPVFGKEDDLVQVSTNIFKTSTEGSYLLRENNIWYGLTVLEDGSRVVTDRRHSVVLRCRRSTPGTGAVPTPTAAAPSTAGGAAMVWVDVHFHQRGSTGQQLTYQCQPGTVTALLQIACLEFDEPDPPKKIESKGLYVASQTGEAKARTDARTVKEGFVKGSGDDTIPVGDMVGLPRFFASPAQITMMFRCWGETLDVRPNPRGFALESALVIAKRIDALVEYDRWARLANPQHQSLFTMEYVFWSALSSRRASYKAKAYAMNYRSIYSHLKSRNFKKFFDKMTPRKSYSLYDHAQCLHEVGKIGLYPPGRPMAGPTEVVQLRRSVPGNLNVPVQLDELEPIVELICKVTANNTPGIFINCGNAPTFDWTLMFPWQLVPPASTTRRGAWTMEGAPQFWILEDNNNKNLTCCFDVLKKALQMRYLRIVASDPPTKGSTTLDEGWQAARVRKWGRDWNYNDVLGFASSRQARSSVPDKNDDNGQGAAFVDLCRCLQLYATILLHENPTDNAATLKQALLVELSKTAKMDDFLRKVNSRLTKHHPGALAPPQVLGYYSPLGVFGPRERYTAITRHQHPAKCLPILDIKDPFLCASLSFAQLQNAASSSHNQFKFCWPTWTTRA